MAKYKYQPFLYRDHQWSLVVDYPPGQPILPEVQIAKSTIIPGAEGTVVFFKPELVPPPVPKTITWSLSYDGSVEELGDQRATQKSPRRCHALAKKGTGVGVCDRVLDSQGHCVRPGDHIDNEPLDI